MSGYELIGQKEDRVPTPALVVDAEILESNIKTMMDHLAGTKAKLRPHEKTFKCPTMGHLLMRAGAIGLCCATVREAEVMVYSGLGHIFIATEVVGQDKILRTVNLCRHGDIIVAVDDEDNIRALSDAAEKIGVRLGILVDLDVGMGRCGARSIPDAIRLAKAVDRSPGLVFRGMFGYEGHAVFIEDRAERTRTGQAANRYLVESAREAESAGLPVEIVSAAGTGTFDIAAAVPGITEIEAGSFVFMDTTYLKLDLPFEPSLTVLSTIVSRPEPEIVILDVGIKGVSVERNPPVPRDHDGMEILKLSEAHATGTLASGTDLTRGDRVHLIPSHCCTTVNLYDDLIVLRDGIVEAVWPIAARGPY